MAKASMVASPTLEERKKLVKATGFDIFACPEGHLHLITTQGEVRVTEHAMDPEDGYSLAASIIKTCDQILGVT